MIEGFAIKSADKNTPILISMRHIDRLQTVKAGYHLHNKLFSIPVN